MVARTKLQSRTPIILYRSAESLSPKGELLKPLCVKLSAGNRHYNTFRRQPISLLTNMSAKIFAFRHEVIDHVQTNLSVDKNAINQSTSRIIGDWRAGSFFRTGAFRPVALFEPDAGLAGYSGLHRIGAGFHRGHHSAPERSLITLIPSFQETYIMRWNNKVSAIDICLLLLLSPIFIVFHDDIKFLLLTISVVWFPLSAGAYLLRWWLTR